MSGSQTITSNVQREQEQEPVILRLQAAPNPDERRVTWDEEVIDNENMGKKSSKSTHPFIFSPDLQSVAFTINHENSENLRMRVLHRHRRMSLIQMMMSGDGHRDVGRICRMGGNHVRDMQNQRECRDANGNPVRMHMNGNLDTTQRRSLRRTKPRIRKHRV